jgi:asparagine synthase (glutamine-hydrolysing)
MCGIAGYIGNKKIQKKNIDLSLKSMIQRGPDNQKKIEIKTNKQNVLLLHSRLSIIDLKSRSNQPFSKHGLKLIFNGEIYNYLFLKDELKKKGYKFTTNSDTEVIISGFNEFGEGIFKKLKGMWSLAIWNNKKKELILSRDRIGEKPLYYFNENNNIFFGSQIKQITKLSKKKFQINQQQIFNYLGLGYRSLEKYNLTFFKRIKKIPSGSYLRFKDGKIETKKYWSLKYKPNYNLNQKDIVSEIRKKVINAIHRVSVSDVPLTLLLSGGVDSNVILSNFKKKIHTFSLIDKNKKYDESSLINKTVKLLKIKNTQINTKHETSEKIISKIKNFVDYNSMPMYTITSYVSSKLHNSIKKKGFKVSLSGIGADEIFTGYYQHTLHYLAELKNHGCFKENYFYWKKHIKKVIRNPHLKNIDNFLKNKNYSKYIFETNPLIFSLINKKKITTFKEKKFCKDALRNRMLNELLYETVPPILNEDDQNHMYSSVENRSPYLDVDLVEYMNTVPTKFLINKGKTKFLLKEAFKDIIPRHIYKNKIKRGFNASFDSIIDRKDIFFKEFILDEKSPIYRYINFRRMLKMYRKKDLSHSESMFFFRLLNCKIFLERFS